MTNHCIRKSARIKRQTFPPRFNDFDQILPNSLLQLRYSDTWSDFYPDCHTLPLNTQQQPCILCVCSVYWYTSVNSFPSTMTHNSQLQTKWHSQDFKPLHLKVHSDGGSVAFLISVPAKPWSKKTFQKLFQLIMSDKKYTVSSRLD